jgi:hypothetical protein
VSETINPADHAANDVAPEAANYRRRRFLAAGAAMAGTAAAAASFITPSEAAADSSITDTPNTWTAPQTIQSQGTDTSFQLHIQAYGHGLWIEQTNDWNGAPMDSVDIIHRSTGDAIFVAHGGGLPPNAPGPEGGNAGFNCLVPYYLDDFATGRGGSVRNDRLDMTGLLIATQATVNGSKAIKVDHWANDPAVVMSVQSPTDYGSPVPQGTGGPMLIRDWSSTSSVRIEKNTAPANAGIIDITVSTDNPAEAVWIRDKTGSPRIRLRSDGTFQITDANGTPKAQINPDGQAWFGINPPGWDARLNVAGRGAGIIRALNIANGNGQAGDGASISFSDFARTYTSIVSTFDRTSPTHNSSLIFNVSSSDSTVERMRMNATGIGFYGVTPAAQPKLTYSRTGEPAAATQIRAALTALGLVSDATK